MNVIEELLRPIPIPKMAPVRQHFAVTRVVDAGAEVQNAVLKEGLLERIQPGSNIAIGVGSRGIANLPELVKATVDLVKARGANPFLVPAMGSHGGATAEGQRAMLNHLGVREDTVGAPIHATMEVVQMGMSAHGLPLFVDRNAAAADGIIVINRIKPHTSFRGPVESGLLKMLVIGLGKQRGADAAHARGFASMADHILDLSQAVLDRLPVLFGVAVIENAYDETAKVAAVASERMHELEPQLLNEARLRMPRISLNDLHVLVVDEIGKNISGVGMDPNVTGRYPNDLVKGDLRVNRIVVLSLTETTDGNAAGLGLADVTTARAESQIDRVKGYMNALTSTSMSSPKLPIVMPTDKQAIQAAVKTCLEPNFGAVRMIRIVNTLKLDEIWVSESLLSEAQAHPDMEVLGPAEAMAFDATGRLIR
ncbi:DUF2088 domain-containing protein [Alicyclobacillus cycloheptanicus]|uniref:Uncharacterized protein (DUF362 family) n=1 Tax=Alicyclobacillus cycloheptanicus TaxID=1457 RepID=A0ABT9XGS0_9BACL|nr:lactate racemase domain-containing protein [Alicyclobacillus cycloheptanicus]MDQ0189509.1 uncharacterized protein (DUF362 family) [Alicyclobacillus cycloheptanicus]WDM01571.1 DUF2088 domain-containing protein [Alicyclobacillus cycloheptanicus]